MEKVLELLVRIFFAIFFRFVDYGGKNRLVEKTVDLYRNDGFAALFVKIRFWDAPLEEIEKMVPETGVVVDLGCGDGILTNYLALVSKGRRVIGVEINRKRIRDADKKLPNTKFMLGSVLEKKIPRADAILMTHLLHHLPSRADQERLIINCGKSLNKGGMLLITEVVERPLVKYLFSWLTDAITVPALFEEGFFTTRFYYRKQKEWGRLLKEQGFKVRSRAVHRGMPFSHMIFVATL